MNTWWIADLSLEESSNRITIHAYPMLRIQNLIILIFRLKLFILSMKTLSITLIILITNEEIFS